VSQDLFRQIGDKLEFLFKKSLHFFIVDKTHGESQPVILFYFGVTHFRHFVKNVFQKEYSVINSFLSKTKKNPKKLPQLQQTICKGVSVFILSYFEYRQIWLNTYLMDYHHLSNITKLILKNQI
jgi:hypothetical protein